MKNRTITKYRQLTKTYYRISHENASWSSTGKKLSCNRYDYNSRGQLKSNKYGKARYVKYYYKKGHLYKRLFRYYSSYGNLKNPLYHKYYR